MPSHDEFSTQFINEFDQESLAFGAIETAHIISPAKELNTQVINNLSESFVCQEGTLTFPSSSRKAPPTPQQKIKYSDQKNEIVEFEKAPEIKWQSKKQKKTVAAIDMEFGKIVPKKVTKFEKGKKKQKSGLRQKKLWQFLPKAGIQKFDNGSSKV